MTNRLPLTLFVALGAGSTAVAAPKAKPAAPAPEPGRPDDVTAIKPKLKVLSDGKGHYVAVDPFGEMENVFYGDGKTFYRQRVFGGGSSGDESFNRMFWEPRVRGGRGAELSFAKKKYAVHCGERKTEFTLLPEADAQKMLDGAAFFKSRWTRQAYRIARDDRGTYYFVDKLRDEDQGFRLFVGMKGAMTQQKMTNVVHDSGGDIFSTKTGELRLVLGQGEGEPMWISPKAKVKLKPLPIEDNVTLIYNDLGVYAGELLGTPCDDM